MGANGNAWPQALADQVIELWNKTRLSATEIGQRVGKTRNAILGKLGRAGLLGTTGRVPCVNNHSKKKKAARRSSSAVRRQPRSRLLDAVVLPPTPEAATSLNVPFLQTKYRQCRYMAGNERVCCGLPTIANTSWCLKHYKLTHTGYGT